MSNFNVEHNILSRRVSSILASSYGQIVIACLGNTSNNSDRGLTPNVIDSILIRITGLFSPMFKSKTTYPTNYTVRFATCTHLI